jgi:hypothetical protein
MMRLYFKDMWNRLRGFDVDIGDFYSAQNALHRYALENHIYRKSTILWVVK